MQAAQELQWVTIEARVVEADDIAAELAMISENLHRADLTVLQRDRQVARWVELVGGKLGQVGPVYGGRGNEGGVRAASRDLGLSKQDASRALKVASLSPDAQQAAIDTGLDDNRTALLEAAQRPVSEQAGYILERSAKPKPDRKASQRQRFWRPFR